MKAISKFILALLIGGAGLGVSAQEKKADVKPRDEMRKELRDYKCKALAEEMELQGETKEKFTEIFNTYFEEQGKLFQEEKKARKELEGKADPTDADYAAYQKNISSIKDKEQKLDKEYRGKLDKILSSKQIYLLDKAEHKFRTKMHQMKASKSGKKCKGDDRNGNRPGKKGKQGKKGPKRPQKSPVEKERI